MRIVAKRGFPVVLLIVGIALGFFLAAQWVPNVSAVPRHRTIPRKGRQR